MMSSLFHLVPFAPPKVFGLHPDDQLVLDQLVKQWTARRPRNMERLAYLDGKTRLKDLKAALPPEMIEQIEIVMGWPVKAVEELANRIVLDGFAGGDQNPLGLGDLLEANRFDVEFPQAVTSSLSQSVAFITTTADDDHGALFQFHSALWSTGLWDRRTRSLSSGLIVTEADSIGRPTRLLLLLPGEAVECSLAASGRWVIDSVSVSGLGGGRIPMEPLPFQPTLERPFGRSRIDRRVMSLTDRGMRAGARLEVHSELFSAIKLILLGVGEEAFSKSKWSWLMDRMNTLTKDEDGDLPKLEQVRAESPEPHIAVMRQLAAEFSGHTGVSLSSLGISTDNPESASARQEARDDVIGHAEAQQRIFGAALRRSFATALMIRDGLSEPPEEARRLKLAWRPPNRPTLAALADAGAKQVAAVPGMAETTVGMELIGLTPDQIERFLDERSNAAPSELSQLAAAMTRSDSGGAAEVKQQADAMGVLIRAGVEPEDAADTVGLDGVEFTGAIPTSLRVPERDAAVLED